MIDKIWHDWQHKTPENFYAYAGGSVAEVNNFTIFTTYPTGLPPFLNVSVSSDFELKCFLMRFASVLFPDPWRWFLERYDLGCDRFGQPLLHLRLMDGHLDIFIRIWWFFDLLLRQCDSEFGVVAPHWTFTR